MVCDRDRIPNLPDLHKLIPEDTYSHDELIALYEDVVKDYKDVYVDKPAMHFSNKTNDAYRWDIVVKRRTEPSEFMRFDKSIVEHRYERLPVRKPNAKTKLRQLKKIMETKYKQLKVKV
jgi:hypothetical protein